MPNMITRLCRHPRSLLLAGVLASMLSGCVLSPKGTQQERARIEQAGKPYEPPVEKRQLPELSQPTIWQQVLQRAFLANGELESAYFDWKAAYSRITEASAWPNSNVSLGFEYMFSSEKLKSWDRTTVSAGFDPAGGLASPLKISKAAEVALEATRAAGERFRTVKFDLQRRVLEAYLDLALTEEKVRVQRATVALLRQLVNSAANRVEAGGAQSDLIKARTDTQMAENDLASLEAQARQQRATLNGMMERDPQATLVLAPTLPPPRPVAADDAALIAAGVDRNPELASLAHQVAGRKDAVDLARLAYLPDINPSAAFTGSLSQTVGAMLTVPTNLPGIAGAIDEAKAMLRSTEAIARQTRSDRAASFVATLYAMRDSERQADLFRQKIIPSAQQLLSSSQQAYASGAVNFVDLVDSQRTLLQAQLLVAQAQIDREKRLAELEALAGVDVETLARPATTAATTTPAP